MWKKDPSSFEWMWVLTKTKLSLSDIPAVVMALNYHIFKIPNPATGIKVLSDVAKWPGMELQRYDSTNHYPSREKVSHYMSAILAACVPIGHPNIFTHHRVGIWRKGCIN